MIDGCAENETRWTNPEVQLELLRNVPQHATENMRQGMGISHLCLRAVGTNRVQLGFCSREAIIQNSTTGLSRGIHKDELGRGGGQSDILYSSLMSP